MNKNFLEDYMKLKARYWHVFFCLISCILSFLLFSSCKTPLIEACVPEVEWTIRSVEFWKAKEGDKNSVLDVNITYGGGVQGGGTIKILS